MKHIIIDDYKQYKDIMLSAHTKANIIYVHKDHVCTFEKENKIDMAIILSEENIDDIIFKNKDAKKITIIESEDLKRLEEIETRYMNDDVSCAYCTNEMLSIDDVNEAGYSATIYQCPVCLTKKIVDETKPDVQFYNLPAGLSKLYHVPKPKI